ncbi:MAG: hypothetical protein U0835_27065 [Isosphaeraceae bacterium]
MKPCHFIIAAALLAACAGGCGQGPPPPSDEVITVDKVPPEIMKLAQQHLTGYKIDTAYKARVEGKDAYVLRGKDARGKTREVELSATGEVLELE